MITGSCHCGTVKYALNGDMQGFMHCHCHTCRKIHGTTCSSSALLPSAAFEITEGADALTAYESSPGKFRCFCSRCGAHIYARMEARPEVVVLRVGTFDDDPGIRPSAHIWVADKAPWYEITDDLPQFEGYPDSR